MTATRTSGRGLDPGVAVAIVGLGVAVLLIALFDLATDLPLNDEWIYRWPLERFMAGHGIQLWPGVQPLGALQLVTALPVAAAGAPPRLWRLSVLPFFVIFAFFSWRSARALDASRGRAALAALVVGLSPICLQVATGLMTDIAYLAMLMGAAWTAQRWLSRRGPAYLPAGFILLATLERTQGVAIPLALTLAVAIVGRRPLLSTAWRGLALSWGAALLGAAAPYLLGIATPAMNRPLTAGSLSHTIPNLVGTVIEGPVMASVLLLPLAPLLLSRPEGELRGAGHTALLPMAFGFAAIVAGLVFQLGFGTMIFPGDGFGNWGLGQLHLGGDKSSPWPLPAFYLAEVVVLGVVGIMLLYRRGLWRPERLGNQGVLLVLLSISQLLPMLSTSATDRYHLAVVAPLAPLLVSPIVAPVAKGEVLRRAVSMLLIGLGLTVFVLGEQDYLAWQIARDAAARLAYARGIPAAALDAGYEAQAKYVAVPAGRTGVVPSDLNPSNLEPRHPRWRLRFAPAGAAEPGISYGATAPGRIVIVPAGN